MYFSYSTNLDIYDDNSDYEYENLKNIGKPYKITFKDGMKFSFGSNEGISNWSVSFFTADDYKEYQSSEKVTTASSQSSSTSSSSIATPAPVVLNINDFITKYDNSELDTNLTYQFDAEPTAKDLWGLDSDGKEYVIDIKDPDYDLCY